MITRKNKNRFVFLVFLSSCFCGELAGTMKQGHLLNSSRGSNVIHYLQVQEKLELHYCCMYIFTLTYNDYCTLSFSIILHCFSLLKYGVFCFV